MLLSAIAMSVVIVLSFWERGEKDSSYVQLSKINVPKVDESAPLPLGISVGKLVGRDHKARPKPLRKKKVQAIKYAATQVIERDGGRKSAAPIASRIEVVLSYPLDTRYQGGMVEAILPRAFRYRGREIIAKGTVLIGRMSYHGQGERVQVNFYRGVTPGGVEFELAAQAMDAEGAQPGIKGAIHSNARGRMGKAMGLSAISNITDVLTQKEALGKGRGTSIEYKPTVPNALLYSAGKATRQEANRRMGRIGQGEDYVVVAAGTASIVVLTESFKGAR